MSVFAPRSAKNAGVRINSNVYTARKWVVTPKVDELDVSNFETGGYGDEIGGLLYAEFTVDADMDGNQNAYDSPISVQPGTVLSNVFLYLNGPASGPHWAFTSVLVLD